MRLKEQWILGLYSDTSLQEVEVACVLTDGLDILKVENSFNRPYPYELKDKLLNINDEQVADKSYLDTLEYEATEFFVGVLKEALESCAVKPDYISVMGPIIKNSAQEKRTIEIGDLKKIAAHFKIPVIGHFMQGDLSAGGVGSPLKTVFWEALARNIEKPLIIANIGGILKLTYLGPNGEMMGFDVGIGTRLMDEWVFKKTGQSQDEDGWLSAQGKADKKVVKAMLAHPFFKQKPPKAVAPEEFESLIDQLEGLSAADGCATLVDFFIESFKKADTFLPERPKRGIVIGGGLKNPSLFLALKQALPEIQKGVECFPFHKHLNAIGTAFLGARRLMNLPISLPTTTGVKEAVSGGEIFDPAPDK